MKQDVIRALAQPRISNRKPQGATLLLRKSDEGVCTKHGDWAQSTVNGVVFRYKAGEFFQNNEHALPVLVDHVVRQVTARDEHTNITHLVDAYCGVGLFALILSKSVQVSQTHAY